MRLVTRSASETRQFGCRLGERLAPGDVIVSGTTGGVGAFREPPVWMKPGDSVEIEISGIGILRNSIADEQ